MTSQRFALIGAHLLPRDLEGVSGLTIFEVGPVLLSATSFDQAHGLPHRLTMERVATIRTELTERETFVAIRYGNSVRDGHEAATMCAPFTERWRELLERHRGSAEMTLKIGSGLATRPERRDFASGAEYLRALRAMRLAAGVPEAIRNEAEGFFRTVAEEFRWIERQDGSAELAMLIRRERLNEARSAAIRLKAAEPSLPFLFSGPWPLEIFAEGQADER